MKPIQYVHVTVIHPEAAARIAGLPVQPGRYRVASARAPETRTVLGGTVRIETADYVDRHGIARTGGEDADPWLPDLLADEYLATKKRYPKGEDASLFERERLRLIAARAMCQDALAAAPSSGTAMHDRFVEALAEVHFGCGVSLANAVAAIGVDHAERVQAVYRDGSTAGAWAELAESIERAFEEEQAREKHAQEFEPSHNGVHEPSLVISSGAF